MSTNVSEEYFAFIFKFYQQLKKKSAATALNTVLVSAHIQMT
jgi:hypothetical protein